MSFRGWITRLARNPFWVLSTVTMLLLLVDHAPRFYQGDSLSYLTTGLNGWIPPDRSWAYGYGGRLLVTWSRRIWVLLALQGTLLAFGIASLNRALAARVPLGIPLLLPVALLLDPLNQAYARAWLSDTPACALFLAALASMLGIIVDADAGLWWRKALRLMTAITLVVATVLLRVAYVPIVLGTLLLCLLATLRPAGTDQARWMLRRRILLLCLVPFLATGLLAEANARVAMPRFLGQLSVNRMSSVYSMFVFLPALHRSDLARAGIVTTPATFAQLHLERYDGREGQLWNDGPEALMWQMRHELAGADPYDPRLQREAREVLRSALLRHPQDLLATYAWSGALYLSPYEWSRVIRGELGFEAPLPEWTRGLLEWRTGTKLPADLASRPSLWSTVLFAVAAFYPVLIGAGLLAALSLLVRRSKFDAGDLIAAAMVASFAMTPLYSHTVKPRYVLAPVLLSGWCLTLAYAAVRGPPPRTGATRT